MLLLSDYIQLCRLNRPIGIWLLLFPGLVGLSASSDSVPLKYWMIFVLGAIVMRSAGCIYNDIVDRPFDGRVDRTKNRPLVRKNRPLSLRWALVFLALNLAVGLICLLQFNLATIYMGFGAAAMIITYPWMKRITYWPQLFLGFTMNMGFIIGCFAVNESVSFPSLLMYLGMVVWTLGYDTIYGFQDMDDDALIGVRSSALRLRHSPRMFVALMYLGTLVCWGLVGALSEFQAGYYVWIMLIAALFSLQVITLNIQDAHNCLIRFKSNQWIGLILWCAVLVSR
ncbi:MAG: 4-hydroxybenzoate octaprenyltransferase [Alphaproteobacteria bacterium]|nr:4-hydroxybenzoate octaprenyltransferase [Alphaproteobacteria bacterium]